MNRRIKSHLVFFVFLLPALFAFFMVIVIPFFIGLYYSFTDWNGISKTINWVGFSNYTESFKNDPRFLYSLIITIIYTFLNVLLVNIVSFTLALLVTKNFKFKNFYRVGFFVPNLIGGLILGYIWQFIFKSAFPAVLGPVSLPFINDNRFLSRPGSALLALVFTGTWQYAGYIMMIYVTALQNIPKSLIEAADIDGASSFQKLRKITIPMVAQAFTITLFLTLLNSFKQFDVNLALTAGGPATIFKGEAINGTELLALNIYNTANKFNKMAEGQAKAVIFFIVLTIISIIQVYTSKKREVEL